MKYTKEEYLDTLETLTDLIYDFIEEKEIDYREVDKPKETWSALCILSGNRKQIKYNNHCKVGKEIMKKAMKPFIILHELGHYYDEDYSIKDKRTGLIIDKNMEIKADNFIYYFCLENLNVKEFDILFNYISACSKITREYTKKEMEILGEK